MLSCFSHVWLCDSMNYRSPGSSVHGILQARVLEWVAIPSSSGSSPPMYQIQVSCISCIAGRFFTTESPRTPTFMNYQILLSDTHVTHVITICIKQQQQQNCQHPRNPLTAFPNNKPLFLQSNPYFTCMLFAFLLFFVVLPLRILP